MGRISTPTHKPGKPLTSSFQPNHGNLENPGTSVPLSPFQAFFRQPTKLVYPAQGGDSTRVPISVQPGKKGSSDNSILKPAFNQARTNVAQPNSYVFQDNNPALRPSSPSTKLPDTNAHAASFDHLFGWHRAQAAVNLIKARPGQSPLQGSPASIPAFDFTTIAGVSLGGAPVNPGVPAGDFFTGAGVRAGGNEQ